MADTQPTAPSHRLRTAAHILRSGGIVAYPTEGVYGLGCLPDRPASLERLIRLKGRDPARGFVLIGADLTQLEAYTATLPAESRERLIAGWPAPLTWVVPAHANTPRPLTGGRDTIAVRVPDHALARALCRAAGSAIVSTSANPSGRPPARTTLAVRRLFGLDVDFVLHGRIGTARGPSEIRDFATGRVLRA